MILNFKNVAENMFIAFVFTALGLVGGYFIAIHAAEKIVETQKSIIVEAIQKETTAIHNTFDTKIEKLKVKKDGKVDLSIDPTLHNKASTDIYKTQDSIPEKKKGFLKRLFTKNKQKK